MVNNNTTNDGSVQGDDEKLPANSQSPNDAFTQDDPAITDKPLEKDPADPVDVPTEPSVDETRKPNL